MLKGSLDPKEHGFYITLGQVGLEMVAPLIVGVVLDHNLGWKPWGTISGAVLGFVGGMGHLIALVARRDGKSSKPPPEAS